MLSVIDFDVEFGLDSVMEQDTSFDVHVVVLVVPVRLECHGNTIPTVRVDMAEAVATDLDDALGKDMRFLVQVDVVLIGVVESADGANRGDLLQTNLLGHLLEYLQHHFYFNNYL